MVILSAVDKRNEPLFTMADLEALQRKSARALDTVFQAAQKLNGLTNEDAEELLGN